MKSFNADSLQVSTVMVVGASSGIEQSLRLLISRALMPSSAAAQKINPAVRDSLANPERGGNGIALDYLNREQVQTAIAVSLTDINHLVIPAVADEMLNVKPLRFR